MICLVLSNPIPDARLGQNNPRVVGVIFNLVPQLADIDTQILRILRMRRAPHRSENLFMGHHAAGMPGQE